MGAAVAIGQPHRDRRETPPHDQGATTRWTTRVLPSTRDVAEVHVTDPGLCGDIAGPLEALKRRRGRREVPGGEVPSEVQGDVTAEVHEVLLDDPLDGVFVIRDPRH